jgi:hypothetical protein
VIEDTSLVFKPCIFPFKYRGKTLNDCTIEEKPWCSTRGSTNGVHIPGSWGYCGKECVQKQLELNKAELYLINGKNWLKWIGSEPN